MTTSQKLLPLVGYHGCDKSLAEKVLAGRQHLETSANDYDWLGSGVYFWADSFARAYDWAKASSKITRAYVVGALIDPGNCLNLTDYGIGKQLQEAHGLFLEAFKETGQPLPENQSSQNGISMARRLDCAVINYLHALREETGEPEFDTVLGVFEEGNPLFDNSALKQKTHIQIAVRNRDAIRAYFRPKELCAY